MMPCAPNGCILPTVGDVSVLVVDDHAVFAEAVQAWLAREADLRPIWTAAGVAEAGTLIDRYQPRVIVLDLVLGDGSGLDVLDHARIHAPDTRTLILSAASSTDDVIAALRHGARAWLPKTVTADHLVEVIRGVVRGEAL